MCISFSRIILIDLKRRYLKSFDTLPRNKYSLNADELKYIGRVEMLNV